MFEGVNLAEQGGVQQLEAHGDEDETTRERGGRTRGGSQPMTAHVRESSELSWGYPRANRFLLLQAGRSRVQRGGGSGGRGASSTAGDRRAVARHGPEQWAAQGSDPQRGRAARVARGE